MCLAALVCALGSDIGPASAQVEITLPEAGRIKTTAKVENGILGVLNAYTRRRGFGQECVGACFYATTTRTKTWVCRESECSLDCSGREPVGGC